MAANGGGVAVAAGVVAHEPGSGRFLGTTGLTDKQTAFVAAYVTNGANGGLAAEAAGYSSERDAWRLLRNRTIRDAIAERMEAQVLGGGVVGLGVLTSVAQDKAAPAAARVSAAKWLAEAAGFGLAARKSGELVGDDRPLEERSLGELEQIAADLHAQLAAARAGVIEGDALRIAPESRPGATEA